MCSGRSTQLKGIDPVHVTKCGVRVYHHVPPVVLYVSEGVNCTCAYNNMPYDGVQFMYTTMQVCAQVHKAV